MSAGSAVGAAEPFAWTHEDGSTALDTTPDSLNPKRVTQCALARVCGVCAQPLGRPVAFVGTEAEVARNEFHAPPLHADCAEALLRRVDDWSTTLTSGFELVRPGRDDPDRHKRFIPNSLV